MPEALEPQPSLASVTRTPVATRARIYYADFQTIWSWMQRVYAKDASDSAARTNARRALFRNDQISVLAQIHAKPESRMPMFLSLVAQAEATRKFDGLESIFLTLLHAANESDQREVFDRALTAWKRFGAQPTVAGAGQVLFYDVTARRLVHLSRDASASLRTSGRNIGLLAPGQAIGESISKMGSWAFESAFERTRMQTEAVRPGESGGPGPIVLTGAEATFHTMLVAGEVLEAIPAPEPTHIGVGAILVLVGGSGLVEIEIQRLWDELERQILSSSEDGDVDNVPVGTGVIVGTEESPGGPTGVGINGDPGGDDPSGCFVGDSTILMGDGLAKAIADVQEGDAVMAWNEVDRLNRLRRVTRVHRHDVNETLLLTFNNGQSLTTTAPTVSLSKTVGLCPLAS
jgi:hypothetical protein